MSLSWQEVSAFQAVKVIYFTIKTIFPLSTTPIGACDCYGDWLLFVPALLILNTSLPSGSLPLRTLLPDFVKVLSLPPCRSRHQKLDMLHCDKALSDGYVPIILIFGTNKIDACGRTFAFNYN